MDGLEVNDRISDVYGGLGAGTILSFYYNYADDSAGVETAICLFGEGDDSVHADRKAGEIERAPAAPTP